MTLTISKFIFLAFFLSPVLFSQSIPGYKTVTDTFKINFNNTYRLSRIHIQPSSEFILLKDRKLVSGEYEFDSTYSFFKLVDTLSYSIYDTLIINYLSLDFRISREFYLRELVRSSTLNLPDSGFVVSGRSSGLSTESIFGEQLQKSGTLVRGFTIGTNKDFSLQSGLKLQISGRLSEDIEIVAALSDENTPLQPEGNTETLEEIDKVFIQIKHKNATAVFGDFDLVRNQGEFLNVNRKLQGLSGEFNYENYTGFAAIAGSRGKFHKNMINGLDGVQGPYRLSGANGERDIIIIAGSERVYLDGELMTRGENNDYTIDYSNSEVTFTTNRLIISSSRIIIEFEYSDRKYSRNFFAAGTGASFFNNKFKFDFSYFREGDNKDAPIDFLLSDDDKKILEAAGDDPLKATKSGIGLAPPDSLGVRKGVYQIRDSTILGEKVSYFVYSPGDSASIYLINFSYVGENRGDYIRIKLGEFRYAGKNGGNYLPVIFLPLPELKELFGISLSVEMIRNLSLKIDLAVSKYDQNLFSDFDNEDNTGIAGNINLTYRTDSLLLFNTNLGRSSISVRSRYTESKFVTLEPFNSLEFDRKYYTGTNPQPSDENLTEITLNHNYSTKFRINSGMGRLSSGDDNRSERYFVNLESKLDSLINTSYSLEYTTKTSRISTGNWLKQKGSIIFDPFFLKPGIYYEGESKKEKNISSDLLNNNSLSFYEAGFLLESEKFWGITLDAKLSYREETFPINGIFVKESKATGQEVGLFFDGSSDFNTDLRVTVREKRYTNQFKLLGYTDVQTVLIKSRSRLNLFDRSINGDFFYEASTQRQSILQRVFVKVEKGRGNYIYLGDLNNNGIADENEFELSLFDGEFIAVTLPTDELFPVIDLKAGVRFKIQFDRLVGDFGFLSEALKNISTETVLRIEENSKDPDIAKIYLLNFSAFRDEKNTIRGYDLIQQDIFLFENSSELNFRFRFSERRSLSQFAGGTEKGFGAEKSIRSRIRLVKEFSLQVDAINLTNNLAAANNSNRNRKISSNDLIFDLSYRPERNIEVGFKLKAGKSEDAFPVNPTEINTNTQSLRGTYSFAGNGRLRVEIERAELVKNNTNNLMPFELTGGNSIGKNYYWRANFDFRLAANLQSTAGYEGRWQGSGRVIHTARAEVKAFF